MKANAAAAAADAGFFYASTPRRAPLEKTQVNKYCAGGSVSTSVTDGATTYASTATDTPCPIGLVSEAGAKALTDCRRFCARALFVDFFALCTHVFPRWSHAPLPCTPSFVFCFWLQASPLASFMTARQRLFALPTTTARAAPPPQRRPSTSPARRTLVALTWTRRGRRMAVVRVCVCLPGGAPRCQLGDCARAPKNSRWHSHNLSLSPALALCSCSRRHVCRLERHRDVLPAWRLLPRRRLQGHRQHWLRGAAAELSFYGAFQQRRRQRI